MDNLALRDYYSKVLKKINANTKIEVLKDEETKDLIETLKKKGIDLSTVGGAIDLGGIKLIYTYFDRASGNKEVTPEDEFKRALNSLNGKPLALDHELGKVVGHYVATKIEGNKAIAYAVFYKRHFPEIWKIVQERAKKGTLKHSWHILNPKGSNGKDSNGNTIIKDMILSGGSLVLKGQAAYPEAYVLRTAEKRDSNENKTIYCLDKLCNNFYSTSDITEANYLVCDKCGYNSVRGDKPISKCPRCGSNLRLATEDEVKEVKEKIREGEIYITCPKCSLKDWKIEEDKGNIKIIRCLSCLTLYEIKFSNIYFPFQTITKRSFLCPSCRYDLSFYTASDMDKFTKEVRCPNCGLEISIPLDRAKKLRRIIYIKEISNEIEDNLKWFDEILEPEGGE